jgi:cupin superfamily acireductone dioxygenase involved in methionine salvage
MPGLLREIFARKIYFKEETNVFRAARVFKVTEKWLAEYFTEKATANCYS